VILIVLALGLVDMGLVRRMNVLDTWVQKLTAAVIAGGATISAGTGSGSGRSTRRSASSSRCGTP
jgi:hypothetical protein